MNAVLAPMPKRHLPPLRIVLSHCWTGHSKIGWYPELQREARAAGFEVVAPDLPDPDTPSPAAWREALAAAVGRPDPHTVLVGHSLGTVNVLNYLAALPRGQQVGGAVLVAPFDGPIGIAAVDAFVGSGPDLAAARAACRRFHLVCSDDDPYLGPDPLAFALRMGHRLDASVHVVHGGRHFSPSAGPSAAPHLIRWLRDWRAAASLEEALQ
ncbi:MAG TPA: alpha/beta fold hydrolase [Lysobacter sp.]|nr:alpha/beta fold hydrolase [Lysobacter sp.]